MQATRGLAAVLCLTHLSALAASQGQRTSDSPAYELAAAYTADLWRNAHGGLRTGGSYLDNLDLTLSIDGGQAWGGPGLRAFVYVLYNNGATFSERYVGDAMVVSNIDALERLRLYEAWLEWSADSARSPSVRFGLYDLNSEFDTNDTRSLFIHSSHGVGHELGQTGENGPSVFPVTSLGVRMAWEPASEWRILAAVLDGVPGDRDRPERSAVHLSSEEGALAIAEAQWSRGPLSKLSVGHWRYTAAFADVRVTDGAPLSEHRDNSGSYVSAQIALGKANADSEPVASAFVRYGVANGRVNEFDEYFGLGVRRRGLSGARPDDELGLALSWAGVSGAALAAAAMSSGGERDRYEAAIEMTYRATINDWLTIQPDVQYIINPGADAALPDSLALGLRFELSWAQSR